MRKAGRVDQRIAVPQRWPKTSSCNRSGTVLAGQAPSWWSRGVTLRTIAPGRCPTAPESMALSIGTAQGSAATEVTNKTRIQKFRQKTRSMQVKYLYRLAAKMQRIHGGHCRQNIVTACDGKRRNISRHSDQPCFSASFSCSGFCRSANKTRCAVFDFVNRQPFGQSVSKLEIRSDRGVIGPLPLIRQNGSVAQIS